MTEQKDILEQAVQSFRNQSVPEGPSQDLLARTLEQIESSQENKTTNPYLERIYKMKSFSKLAVAAVLIIGVTVGLTLMPSSSGVVWAEVLEQIQSVQVFSYRMQMTVTGESLSGGNQQTPMNMEATMTFSDHFGMKMETFSDGKIVSQNYVIPEEKAIITVMPEEKRFMRIELTDQLLDQMKQDPKNQDPRQMINEVVSEEYTSLGKATINGVEAEGIESTDPRLGGGVAESVRTVVWADVKTGYPIQIEMEMKMNEGKTTIHMVIYDFQWNLPVDPDIFQPVISEDYSELPGFKMPNINEETAIHGLQLFRDLTGRYPKDLNMMALSQEITEAIRENADTMREEFKDLTEDELIKKSMDIMMPYQSLGMFYMQLIQLQKDPVYYGKEVQPGASGSILLRWKDDDGNYRVIFGDLTAETVTAQQLEQMEQGLTE